MQYNRPEILPVAGIDYPIEPATNPNSNKFDMSAILQALSGAMGQFKDEPALKGMFNKSDQMFNSFGGGDENMKGLFQALPFLMGGLFEKGGRIKKYQKGSKVKDSYDYLVEYGIINPKLVSREEFSKYDPDTVKELMQQLPLPGPIPGAITIAETPIIHTKIEEKETRDDAFRKARARGDKVFEFEGKMYTTEIDKNGKPKMKPAKEYVEDTRKLREFQKGGYTTDKVLKDLEAYRKKSYEKYVNDVDSNNKKYAIETLNEKFEGYPDPKHIIPFYKKESGGKVSKVKQDLASYRDKLNKKYEKEYKDRGVGLPVHPLGQFAYPGEPVIVPTNTGISMDGIPYDVEVTRLGDESFRKVLKANSGLHNVKPGYYLEVPKFK